MINRARVRDSNGVVYLYHANRFGDDRLGLAGRYPVTRCLSLQWAHQRCQHARVMVRRETLTPTAEIALLPIGVPSVVQKKEAP